MSDFMEFGFGDNDEKVTTKARKYKGEAGNTDRLSFVWWDTDDDGKPMLDSSPKFTGAKRHYVPGVGYFLSKGPEYTKLAGGPAKLQVATIVAVWPTDREGNIDKKRLSKVQIVPWIFSADKYETLKRRHNQFHVGSHDIMATCTDSNFQKMDFSPCTESLYATLLANDKDSAQKIVAKIQDEVAEVAGDLQGMIARDLSLDQIREKLGGGSGAALVDSAVAGEEVDAILDDLVE